MAEFNVKAWVSVRAEDEREAVAKAADILDTVSDEHRASVSIDPPDEVEFVEPDHIQCPVCGAREGFEKRGEQRTYHKLFFDLAEDGWDGGELTMDTDDEGNDIIYCLECSSEFTEDELRKEVKA